MFHFIHSSQLITKRRCFRVSFLSVSRSSSSFWHLVRCVKPLIFFVLRKLQSQLSSFTSATQRGYNLQCTCANYVLLATSVTIWQCDRLCHEKNNSVVSHNNKTKRLTAAKAAESSMFSSQINFIQFCLCNNLITTIIIIINAAATAAATFPPHLHPYETVLCLQNVNSPTKCVYLCRKIATAPEQRLHEYTDCRERDFV